MRFRKLFAVALCLLVGLVVAQDDKPKKAKPSDQKPSDQKPSDVVAKDEPRATSEIVVYPASNSPASSLAAVLPDILDDDTLQVVADPISNLLLIRVASNSRDEVLSLLKLLDRPQRTVIVNAYLLKLKGEPLSADDAASLSGPSAEVAKKIAALQADDRLVVANHIELAALENQPSVLQIGEDVSVASGVTAFGGPPGSARRTTSFRAHSTGTILTVSARTTPGDAIALTVDYEMSGFEVPEPKNDEEGGPQAPPSLTRLTHQSTLMLDNSHARLSGALAGGTAADSKHAYIVVSARIAEGSVKQRVASSKTFSRLTESRPSGFGGRPKTESDQSRSSKPLNLDERYLAYYTKIVHKYDQDGDGKLNADEWGTMSKDPSAADTNANGFITPEELTLWSRKR